ncbi:MAG: ABC transporter permease [Actinomycetota bacterium]|nr:ABC transporter permease [Actinomycetota bacterium]
MHSFLRFFSDLNRKNTVLLIGGLLSLALVLVAVLAPWIEPHDPTLMQTSNQFIAPNAEYPFGTDNLGRCIFSRVVEGSRVSLATAGLVVLFGAVLGSVIGLTAGFAGGKVDGFLMRLTDVFLAFPTIVFALAISAVLGTGEINLIIALMLIHWTRYARLVRGEVVLLRGEEFIESAKAMGNSSFRITTRYLVPSVLSKVVVMMSLDLGSVILFCSALSFLGLGAQPPSPDWGAMISDGRDYLRYAPWMSFFPGFAIAFSALSFNLLGDGIRDLTDPRMREHAVVE